MCAERVSAVRTPRLPRCGLLHDHQSTELDGVDEGESEVFDEQPRDGRLVDVGRGQIEPEPGPGQVAPVGEANLEVEVGAMVGHGSERSQRRWT